ncbi:DUF6602 domain-containing protein [Nitrospinota bacterium]
MAATKPIEIDKLFEGSLQQLRTEAKFFSSQTAHAPELGRLNETHLVRSLRKYLPPKFGIGTGFIWCGGKNQRQSPQCDIVLFDALNNAPLYKSDAWSIFPIEMVYGVIEVKTKLTKKGLRDAFEKCAKIRAMAINPNGRGNKAYIRQVPFRPNEPAKHKRYWNKLPPRFFVFGYGNWKKGETLERNFKAVTKESKGAHIHGVCSLYDGGSLFIGHQAFGKGEGRFSGVFENGFPLFLMNLRTDLDSMLPAYPEIDTHRGLLRCFDQIDLKHYDLSVE